jgi:hypothetical protein
MPRAVVSDPPIFIVGCGRSGTTLLRLTLDRHPDLAIPGESHFIPYVWRERRTYTARGDVDARRLAERIVRSPHVRLWGIPHEALRRRIAELHDPDLGSVIAAVFQAYADAQGKPRWGDKTPRYVRHLDLLDRLFPNARFLHVIRDGRDVALSYLSLPWGPATVRQAALKWRRDVSAGLHAGRRLGDRYLEVRYESLVNDPAAVLEGICAFAGLTWKDEMLEGGGDAGRLYLPEELRRFHTASLGAPRPGLRDWRSQMDPEDLWAFEAIAGDTLEQAGYRRATSRPAAGTRAAAGAYATWARLRERGWRAKQRFMPAGRRRSAPPGAPR